MTGTSARRSIPVGLGEGHSFPLRASTSSCSHPARVVGLARKNHGASPTCSRPGSKAAVPVPCLIDTAAEVTLIDAAFAIRCRLPLRVLPFELWLEMSEGI